MKKVAVVVGSGGQDGQLLTKHLLAHSYQVVGIGSKDIDIFDRNAVDKFLTSIRPDEIYYLAAYHHSSESVPQSDDILLQESMKVHYDGILNFLEVSSLKLPKVKIFYASSSHIYGGSESLQNESTPYEASSVYAQTKIAGMKACHDYREQKGLHVSVGILYNHESPLRSPKFVSRKISSAVAKIKLQQEGSLELGDLDVTIDWGYAGDYVEAFWKILQLPYSDDFVVSTGVAKTLREFVEIAFSSQGFDYRKYVTLKNDIVKRQALRRVGDYSKLHKATGWKPATQFEELIKMMVQNDIELLSAK